MPTAEALALAGRRVIVHESADGRLQIRCGANILPCSVLDKQPLVPSGEVVENKRLGSVLALIQAGQDERDQRSLTVPKVEDVQVSAKINC